MSARITEILYKMRFNTHFSRSQSTPDYLSDQPSLTVPDQSLTIKQILQRYAQGRPLDVFKNLTYTGDEYVPDPRDMDFTDIEETHSNIKEYLSKVDAARQKARASAAAQKASDDAEEESEEAQRTSRTAPRRRSEPRSTDKEKIDTQESE